MFGYRNDQAACLDRLPLATGCCSETFEGVFEFTVHEVCVDQRRGEVPVSESALDNEDVAGSAVEVGCECVAERMRAELPVDTCRNQPVLQPPCDLPFAEPFAAVGEKQGLPIVVVPGRVVGATAGRHAPALFQVGPQEGA